MKKLFIDWLNRHGLFTFKQWAEVIDERAALRDYATYLEKSIEGMSDPTKPIIVLGNRNLVQGITLQPGQQIIVSPFAKYTVIQNIYTIPRTAAQAGGA